MRIAAKVAGDKLKHPEQFCPYNICLWRTHGGYCPRHEHLAPDAEKSGKVSVSREDVTKAWISKGMHGGPRALFGESEAYKAEQARPHPPPSITGNYWNHDPSENPISVVNAPSQHEAVFAGKKYHPEYAHCAYSAFKRSKNIGMGKTEAGSEGLAAETHREAMHIAMDHGYNEEASVHSRMWGVHTRNAMSHGALPWHMREVRVVKKAENNDEIASFTKSLIADLFKGKNPGQPIAPRPAKPRAPRTPSPFDPAEGATHSSEPYQFRPHKLKDLYKLHLLDAYQPQVVRKDPVSKYVAKERGPKPSFHNLKTMLMELRKF